VILARKLRIRHAMKAWWVGLAFIAVGCARARPPDVALVARYEMLRSGPQTVFSIELAWPLERTRGGEP
jgi:hypothetical protein